MRVIAGTAKGRRLKSVPGRSTRPITDRVKESVFDIISAEVVDATFLDLFAGTGAVGIEALSRGARSATFVEIDSRAVATIRANLDTTGLGERATVVRRDAFRFVKTTPEKFDIVYVAPPQYQRLWLRALRALDGESTPAADLVIVQMHPKEFEEVACTYFVLDDQRQYGSTLACFYRRIGGRDYN